VDLNLNSGEVYFTKDVETQDILSKWDNCLTLNIFHKMSNYENRLKFLVLKGKNSALLSFKTFVQYGASARESVVLKNALRSIRKFTESFAGDMHGSNNAWV